MSGRLPCLESPSSLRWERRPRRLGIRSNRNRRRSTRGAAGPSRVPRCRGERLRGSNVARFPIVTAAGTSLAALLLRWNLHSAGPVRSRLASVERVLGSVPRIDAQALACRSLGARVRAGRLGEHRLDDLEARPCGGVHVRSTAAPRRYFSIPRRAPPAATVYPARRGRRFRRNPPRRKTSTMPA